MTARLDGQPKRARRHYPYGVTWNSRMRRFVVKFKRQKRDVYVGSYTTLGEAKEVAENYVSKRIKQ